VRGGAKILQEIINTPHTLKTTTRYFACEYFATTSEQIEGIIINDYEDVDKLYYEYMQCFQWLYDDAKVQYDKMVNVRKKRQMRRN
jgi:hypothetical protein